MKSSPTKPTPRLAMSVILPPEQTSIDAHNVFGVNWDRRTRQYQSATEAHLHSENPPLDCCSISQPAGDARAIMQAEPFTERVTPGFVAVMDEKRGRSIGTRENFHHFHFKRIRSALKY